MAAAATVHCRRCGRAEAPALTRPPLPGALGRDILEHNCADCWAEWTRLEVMVINELRLNFMDAGAQEILAQHMREFFDPAERPASPGPGGSAPEPGGGTPGAGGSPAAT